MKKKQNRLRSMFMMGFAVCTLMVAVGTAPTQARPTEITLPKGGNIQLPTPGQPGGAVPTPPPFANQAALQLKADKETLKHGESTRVTVQVTADDLYAGQMKFTFDPNEIEVVGGVVLPDVSPLKNGNHITVIQSVDNVNGTIAYAASLLGDRTSPKVEQAELFSFTVKAKAGAKGNSKIELKSQTLLNSNVEMISLAPGSFKSLSIQVKK
ncbi:cohesin domain-containing protein [Ammoniphilus sp. YIM 78166]|uniref:cohesin domain-containing protein n=1 Tax=Ammoniphilus sp. YIM 78166 TaxID=1644106 RepID=UPI00106F2AC9|nr:cohesin domain-containing protein [Ammoniphilus sp. YIM 78166]